MYNLLQPYIVRLFTTLVKQFKKSEENDICKIPYEYHLKQKLQFPYWHDEFQS